MRAGELDQRISFVARPTTKSPSGDDVPGSPVTYATVYARITPAKGQRPEFYQADRLNVKTKYDVRVRYVAGLTEDMEIIWGSRVLNILSIPDAGKRPGWLLILAEEQR